jgi:hypothetical protein
MASFLPEDLTDTVYRAALEPAAWHDVMELMGSSFPSVAQTFYFLRLSHGMSDRFSCRGSSRGG